MSRLRLFVFAVLLATASSAHAIDYLAASGETLYGKFCASCHGKDARGKGPVAAHLKVAPPDLTLIAKYNGGRFDAERIEKIIDGRIVVGVHGSRAMPVWGEELTRTQMGEPEAESGSQLIIKRIVEYLRGIQAAK
jgi:mono/diheme cytochrome c family protein